MHRRALLTSPLLLAAPHLHAQTATGFPDRPIRLIVPVAVAGAADIVGRILADAMAPLLGKPMVIENIAGAGSTLGAAAFQRAAADGHTLYLATNNHLHMKAAYPQFPVDLVGDFVPLALVSRQPFVLAVNNAVPARSVAELVTWLRGRTDTAHCGASFPGSNNAMAAELFKLRAGVDFTIVPYRAAAASVQDLVAGRLDLTIDSPTLLLPLLRDGLVRGLAVSTAAASPLVPGLAGMQAAGIADYDVPIWTILFARHAAGDPRHTARHRGARPGRAGSAGTPRRRRLRGLAGRLARRREHPAHGRDRPLDADHGRDEAERRIEGRGIWASRSNNSQASSPRRGGRRCRRRCGSARSWCCSIPSA
jgi:tripartite-type tricarboxylate transporter receptor subunit TctC